MRTIFFKHNPHSKASFFALAILIWSSFFFLDCCGQVTPSFAVFFAIIATLSSYIILRTLGYFDLIRLYPRKSDLLLMLVATPLGGLIAHGLIESIFYKSICTRATLLFWTPLLVLVVFGLHYVLTTLLLKSNGRKKIVLDLTPKERMAIVNEFTAMGFGAYLQFEDKEFLEQAFENHHIHKVSMVIISRNKVRDFTEDKTLLRAHLAGIPIFDHARVSTNLTGKVRLTHTDLWSYVLSATPQTPLLRAYSQFKIVAEPLLAAVLAFCLAPLMLLVGLLVKLTSKGPVLYRQKRTGYMGKTFTLIKFRSMCLDAEANGPQWASSEDSRVTPLGYVLRKTRLDELPQLRNIFKGEMGFFGPRPERPEINEALKKELPLFSLRTVVRPGLTGWAQVCYGYSASVAESKAKLEYDLYYIQHMSPRLDFIITVKTLLVFLKGDQQKVDLSRSNVIEFPLQANSLPTLRVAVPGSSTNLISKNS